MDQRFSCLPLNPIGGGGGGGGGAPPGPPAGGGGGGTAAGGPGGGGGGTWSWLPVLFLAIQYCQSCWAEGLLEALL